jgi:hypothetical protein
MSLANDNIVSARGSFALQLDRKGFDGPIVVSAIGNASK